jgi:hypothetical protein
MLGRLPIRDLAFEALQRETAAEEYEGKQDG